MTSHFDRLQAGNRLRDERRRLGLTQDAFAARCGVCKRSQINYENGLSAPRAGYFQRANALGADILFLMTGEKSPGIAEHFEPADNLSFLSWTPPSYSPDAVAAGPTAPATPTDPTSAMHPADITAALKKAGSSQIAIARELNCAHASVWQVIDGRARSVRVAQAIAAKVGIPVERLWPGHYNRSTP